MVFTIRKRITGTSTLYEVFKGDLKIGQRKCVTNRNYVACIVRTYSALNVHDKSIIDRHEVFSTWFGRADLIGKGNSRHLVNKPGISIAFIEPSEGEDSLLTVLRARYLTQPFSITP